MTERRLRVALVGCGQIADAHLAEIRKHSRADLVAVCDRERDLAVQAGARFEVPQIFDNLEQMLAATRPDVVHVATPPQTHKPLVLEVLRSGAHAYVEKPFAVDLAEAEEIVAAAEAASRLVCVGHDHLYDPAWQECRELYEAGCLGQIVHIESVQGYDLSGAFGQQVSGDPEHWVHRLPGGIFHNTISHAVYKITEFLPDEHPQIQAFWMPSSEARAIPAELRVMLRGDRTTASLVSSCASRPVQRVTRIYGTQGSVEIDFDTRLVRHFAQLRWPGPFAKIEGPYRQTREAQRHLWRALRRFIKSELHYFTGMSNLIDRFYRAILEDGPPPISYREICRVTEIMDRIFAACHDSQAESATADDVRRGRSPTRSAEARSLTAEVT
jgi:predicted dehydrogenase